MGLLMDNSGLPLSYDLFPGNESEKLSLRPILKRTKSKYGIEKVIVVADRGLNTADNTFFLAGRNDDDHKNHDGYVYGQSVRGADKEFKNWVLAQKDYKSDKVYNKQGNEEMYRAMFFNESGLFDHYEKKPVIFKHKSRIFAKEVYVNTSNGKKKKTITYQKQMAYYSQKYANKQKRDRQIMIEKAKDLITNPGKYTRATSYGSAAYVNNIKFDKTTGAISDASSLSLNIEKIKEEEKYDGYYSIVTSELNMSDEKMRDTYRGLTKIEDSFKITKSLLNGKPVFVWTTEHIEAHFLTCFIALLIVRLLEKKTDNKYPIGKMIESIKKYSSSRIEHDIYLQSYIDDVIIDLSSLYDVDFRRKYLSISEIKKILND